MAVLRKLLKGLGVLVGLVLTLVIAVFGYNAWLIHTRADAARTAAADLCASLPPGSPIAPGLERARQLGINALPLPDDAGYEFQFMYFLDGWGCRAQVTDGKVTAVAVVVVN